MVKDSSSDFIDSGVNQLLALFQGELAELEFPGVDATTLDAAVAAVTAQAAAVEELRKAHQAAMETLRSEQRALRDHARQAHAYALVFARGNEELRAQLDQVVLDDPTTSAPKKRRTRKPKTVSEAPQLRLESAPAAKAPKPRTTMGTTPSTAPKPSAATAAA